MTKAFATLSAAMKQMQKARTALLLDQPFFGVLALHLLLHEENDCACKPGARCTHTAWTDGKRLGFYPRFILGLSLDQVVGLICHEVMHCAAGHPWRRDNRDPKQWNVAADYAINPIVVDAGMKIPDGGLLDAQYRGKSSEWIYDRLPPPDPNGDGGDGAQGGGDPFDGLDVRDAPTGDDAPSAEDWQQNVEQAKKAAEAQGKLPANMARDLSATRDETQWQEYLAKYATEAVKGDYSWRRPSPRYVHLGLYLPSLHSTACGRFVVAIDTSGSIDSVLLRQFLGRVQAIIDAMQPRETLMIDCDAMVHQTQTFERGDSIEGFKPSGGGGTDFAPVFEAVAAEGDDPAVLIYLTDLYGSFPDVAPDYPVIWVSNGGDDAPFGQVIKVQ